MSVGQASVIALAPVISQYHSQDPFGQYAYGYSGGPSAKQEVRTADGITQGGYSYIDANNLVQSVSYVSDPINGFRVAATNLPQGPSAPLAVVAGAPVVGAPVAVVSTSVPQETPEVVAAKISHFQAHAAARSGVQLLRKRRSVAAFPVAVGYAAYAPIISSQYQTQDTLGQYSYGYNDGLSAKAESRSVDGTVNGGYSYVDANGLVQNVQYTADSLGFRTAATNLPVGPAPAVAAIAPVQVAATIPAIVSAGPLETPEVIAAKAAHFAAHVEARTRLI